MFESHPGGADFVAGAKRSVRNNTSGMLEKKPSLHAALNINSNIFDSPVQSHLGKRTRVQEPFFGNNYEATARGHHGQPYIAGSPFALPHPQVPHYNKIVESPILWSDDHVHNDVAVQDQNAFGPYFQFTQQKQMQPTSNDYSCPVSQLKMMGRPQDVQYPYPINPNHSTGYPTTVNHHYNMNATKPLAAGAADDQWGWYVDAD